MTLELVLKVLEQGLILWNSKEARKYLDRVLKIKKEYYEELSKPSDDRSQLTLDKLLLELETIANTFASAAGKSASDK